MIAPDSYLISAALSLTLLFGPAAAVARNQEEPPTRDRHVTIWQTEGGRVLNLQAIGTPRGFLGVGLLDLTPELRRHFGVPEDRGVMISRVVADSPAERAGFEPADILTTADSEALVASIDLSLRVAGTGEGGEIELERWRDGAKVVVRVPIEIQRREQVDLSPLVLQRIQVDPTRITKVHKVGASEIDEHWIEEVVETVGDNLSEANFVEQLESMRRERRELLSKLDALEERLVELEAELARLHREQ